MISNTNLLKTISLPELTNWSVRYLLDFTFNYNKDFQLVSIGEFLTRNRNVINIEDETTYSRVTVRGNNKGVYLRDTEIGKNIGTKRQYLVSSGQFIISKIDARNGALGIIPDDLEGAIVTNDFPTFFVDNTRINTHFLLLITTTKTFINFAQSCSSGTTNRQRINIEQFLNIKIPLPALTKQNKIVRNYTQKIELARKQETKIIQLKTDIALYFFDILGIEKSKKIIRKAGLNIIKYSKLTKWALSHSLKDLIYNIDSGYFATYKFKELIEFFKGGKTPSKSNRSYWTGGNIYWTSAKDFSGLFIDKPKDSISENAVLETKMEIFPKGTILSVFRSGILRHSFPTSITTIKTTINQDLKAYKLKDEIISSFYYLYFIEVFKEYVLNNTSKKGVTVESINTEEFMQLKIPIPPLEIQNEIVSTIGNLKNQIEDLKSKAEENKKKAIVEFEREIFQPV